MFLDDVIAFRRPPPSSKRRAVDRHHRIEYSAWHRCRPIERVSAVACIVETLLDSLPAIETRSPLRLAAGIRSLAQALSISVPPASPQHIARTSIMQVNLVNFRCPWRGPMLSMRGGLWTTVKPRAAIALYVILRSYRLCHLCSSRTPASPLSIILTTAPRVTTVTRTRSNPENHPNWTACVRSNGVPLRRPSHHAVAAGARGGPVTVKPRPDIVGLVELPASIIPGRC